MDYTKYKNPNPYPKMPKYDRYNTTPNQVRAIKGKFRLEMAEYRSETYHLERVVFKADLIEEFGLEGNPKVDRTFDMAWDRGHSNGLQEVYNEFAELAELIE